MAYPERYTITAALPYANGPIHIGQLAGAYIAPDIFSRYQKLRGRDAVFICGSDEHGVAITLKALKEGSTPQAIVDKYHELNKRSFEEFGISFDIYHRTSEPLHHETAQEIFLKLYEQGKFIEEESLQFYDEEHHQFLADRYIIGTCPNCGFNNAYGDQCEKCGTSLSPQELINPRSSLSGNPPVLRKTKHWYLPMNDYESWLREWVLEEHKEWKKNVYGQCKSWLEKGLQPRAMTRDLDWGVKVPLKEAEGKVLYVWLDAPIGYISATKQWALDNKKDWKLYWQDKETKLVHFIGKDNIVFHCIIFPIILKAHGDYILPDNVPANEFMNMEGDKISTSRNWAVWLHEYLKDFPGKQDVLRYVLTANMPETKDSEFTWKDFQDRNNNELVANLGNFINRVMVLMQKYYKGIIPDADAEGIVFELEDESGSVANARKLNASAHRQFLLREYIQPLEQDIENYNFRSALSRLMSLSSHGNLLLQQNKPWEHYKNDPESPMIKNVMNAAVQVVALLSVVGEIFLPFSAERIRKILNIPTLSHTLVGNPSTGRWNIATEMLAKGEPLILPGHQLEQPELLFEKIEDDVIQRQIDKLFATRVKPETMEEAKVGDIRPFKEEISFDDFMKMDIRIGTIKKAEKVKGADKLLQLEVDMGNEMRTIVSGIAEHFSPEEIINKQVSVLVNLAPRKIRGVESKGMILMAEDKAGKLAFIAPQMPFEEGAEVR